MKKLMTSLLLSISFSGMTVAASNFSAFANGDKLYVTTLGDTCNTYTGTLTVSKSCDERRLTRNFAISCKAELSVMATELFCGEETDSTPKVMEISLAKNNVAKEAKNLKLTYNGSTINVSLNQNRNQPNVNVNLNAKAIYDALNVTEINVSPNYYGSMTFVKNVGGLLCSFEYNVGSSQYNCKFQGPKSEETIYNTLNVATRVLNPGVAGFSRIGKIVGNLECVKESVVYPGAKASYTCNLL